MANFGTTEILIVLFVLLMLFGSTKLPQLARSLGRSARILKAETKGLHEDADDDRSRTAAPQADDPHRRAARLREEAARLEHQATAHEPASHPSALPPGRPIQGVPVSDPARPHQA